MAELKSVDDIQAAMAAWNYICDRDLATSIFLSLGLERPLFLEGEAGVGKTELAKALAWISRRRLIRLQCYEGLDAASALYEWNYPKQILAIKRAETCAPEAAPNIFSEDYLIRRPLLEAIQSEAGGEKVVLLIDELDRADEEFEAFLLEVLSDFTVSIPEIGTLKADAVPVVILTSNRTREVHDALKRRCLYHWIDYPSQDKEYRIITTRLPDINDTLARDICRIMAGIREMDLVKKPGVSESLDWAKALMLLGRDLLDEIAVRETLGCIFKYEEDMRRFRENQAGLVKLGCAPATAA